MYPYTFFGSRLKPSFPFLQCHKAISRATRFSLRRSAGPLSSGVLASGGAERGARLLGGRALYSFRLRSSSSSVPPASSISPARVRFPRRFSGDDGISGVVSGEICARLVLVFLFALGKDLLCSLVSSLFRAGVAVAGRGLPGGLLLRFGGGGAIFVSGGLARHLLETASPSSPSVRSLMVFQRLKSILMGGLGWWFLRLNHAMGLMMEDWEAAASILDQVLADQNFSF